MAANVSCSSLMNAGRGSRSFSAKYDVVGRRRRPIPRRGQIKVGIVLGLAQSLASVFSPTARTKAAPFAPSSF